MRSTLYTLLGLLFYCSTHALEPTVTIADSIQSRLTQLNHREQIHYLGKNCWLLREADRAQSIACGQKAIALADSLGYLSEAAQYSNYLAVTLLFYQSEVPAALFYMNKAYELALKANDSIQLGYAFNNLGDVYNLTGNIPLAQAYADSSLHYFTLLNNAEGKAYAYLNLADAQLKQRNYQQALAYYQLAIDGYPKHQEENIVSTAHIGQARVLTQQEKYDQARKVYEKDLALTRQMKNKTFEASTLKKIGGIQFFQGDYARALSSYLQAEKLFKQRQDKNGLFKVYLAKALLYGKTQERKAGENTLEQAFKLAQKLGAPARILDVYKTRLQFYSFLEEDIPPASLIDQYIALQDSLDLVRQFEILNEVSQKQAVQADLNQAQEEIKSKKREHIYLLLLLAMILVLVKVLVWKNYSTNRLNKELAALNAGKDKLISIISHDLRNPFIAIIQYIDLLKSGELSQAEKKEFFIRLEEQTHSTNALLDNLLNFSAFSIRKVKSYPRLFSLDELLQSIQSELSAQLHLKNLSLQTKLRQKTVTADEKMIEIVLRNIISNAIKYSHPGQSIQVSSFQSANNLCISIADQGKGMTEEQQAQLFNNQFGKSVPGTNGEPGTGIGLNICRELITLHQGWISVESTLGKGTIFSIFLPNDTSSQS